MNGLMRAQMVYAGTDGTISITCLVAGLVAAGVAPGTIALTASVAAFADAISMASSEFHARGDVRLSLATFATFYLVAIIVGIVASRARSLPLIFLWSLFCIASVSLLRKEKTIVPTVVGGAGVIVSYGVGTLLG